MKFAADLTIKQAIEMHLAMIAGNQSARTQQCQRQALRRVFGAILACKVQDTTFIEMQTLVDAVSSESISLTSKRLYIGMANRFVRWLTDCVAMQTAPQSPVDKARWYVRTAALNDDLRELLLMLADRIVDLENSTRRR